MADKKPVYNPPSNDDASKAATKSASNTTRASALASEKTKLSVGAIVGISAAGLALLVGASVAGSAIALAATHGDRPHSQQGAEGMPGDGGRDGNRDGERDGAQDGQSGKSDGRMQHEHDANGSDVMPDGMMPDGQMPGGQMPTGDLPPAPNMAPKK